MRLSLIRKPHKCGTPNSSADYLWYKKAIMFEFKTISKEAIPRSIEKAEHYRLLNEPAAAESICLDVLQVDPENQRALIVLILALTDRFDRRLPESRPRELLARLKDDYERAYYAGIIC